MILHKKAGTDKERELLLKLVKKSGWEGVLVHTCNRVEFFGGTGEVNESIVRHLFRMVGGLESVFIGESFIQGQVKEAYQVAASKWKLDASIHRLFQWALLAGKRVRSETALSRGAMSHSQAVVEIVKEQIPDYRSKRFAFIGVNKINKTIMNFLKGNIHHSFVLCNRTFETAKELEQQFDCRAYKLDHLQLALEQSDIIISATSAPHTIIRPEHIRGNHSLVIFDLAVPNDVDTKVQVLPEIKYYDIRTVEQQVTQNIAGRSAEMLKADEIITDEVNRFMEYQMRFFQRRLSKSSILVKNAQN